MSKVANRRRMSLVLLLAALMLRAGIPDGYMPAAIGSGLLFELCPARVPAELMQALAGSTQHHHHGQSSGAAAAYDASQQCPIGHLLAAAFIADDYWQATAAPVSPPVVEYHGPFVASLVYAAHRSRGPPA